MSLRIRLDLRRETDRAGRLFLIAGTLACLVALNLLLSFLPVRIDLSENHEFSLSPATKKTLRSLDDVITVRAYLSQNLPPRLLPIRQKIKDLLNEYQKLSPQKVRVVFIDPKNNPQLVSEAESLGIPQLRFSDVENDKFSVSTGYLGLSVSFGDQRATVPAVADTTNLEYELTIALRKVSRKEPVGLALSRGHGELDQNQIGLLRSLLEKEFSVSDLTISEKEKSAPVPPTVKTLMMINPTENFGESSLFTLDQFLLKGGRLVVLVSGVNVNNNLQAAANPTNLNQLLENFNLKVNNDLVLSADNEIASFNSNYNAFITAYPFWVRLLPSGFNQNYPATANLSLAVLPWVSSLAIKEKNPNVKVTELAKTTNRSFREESPFNLDPSQPFSPKAEESQSFTVAALASGKAVSLFKGRAVSQFLSKGETFSETAGAAARIALFSNSAFVSDYFLQRYPGNLGLLFNTLESLSEEDGFSEIRVKDSAFRPLRNIPETEKNLIKWGNVLVVPTLITLLGLTRLFLRSKNRGPRRQL